eukprot:5102661-Prymnesium_polylepis.1
MLTRGDGSDPHPRMRSPGAFGAACSAAAETSPTSSRPCRAISAAKTLHTSVHTSAFPHRSPPPRRIARPTPAPRTPRSRGTVP